jgi:hypothetical protein
MADIAYDPEALFKSAGIPMSDQEKALFRQLHRGGDVREISFIVDADVYFARILQLSLKEHADALTRSEEASEKHAKSLTRATWFLGFATFALVLAAIAQVVVPFIKY